MRLGLRIDVDTYRGTRDGLPVLTRVLAARGIRASMFLTAGPDNMGRHLRRLLRPSFLRKMVRSRAAGLYGWDILLRGTMWPGPVIHRRLAPQMKAAADNGHEIGAHAWDHHWWQVAAHSAAPGRVAEVLERAHNAIAQVTGRPPTCVAAPGWRCTPEILRLREPFGYDYASDCRGHGVFQPAEGPPQVCVNLPTWDEVIGRGGVTDRTYNDALMGCLRLDGSDVLTIHAECEGGSRAPLFESFLDRLSAECIDVVPLGELVGEESEPGRIVRGQVPGRDGWVAVRDEAYP
jgi:undecaprenyl phosphate-alpha-L-ara4FN deformylase